MIWFSNLIKASFLRRLIRSPWEWIFLSNLLPWRPIRNWSKKVPFVLPLKGRLFTMQILVALFAICSHFLSLFATFCHFLPLASVNNQQPTFEDANWNWNHLRSWKLSWNCLALSWEALGFAAAYTCSTLFANYLLLTLWKPTVKLPGVTAKYRLSILCYVLCTCSWAAARCHILGAP